MIVAKAKEGYITVNLAPPRVTVERRATGELIVSSLIAMPAYPQQIGSYLRRWAECAPNRTFLAERSISGDWRTLTYAEARTKADRISESLLRGGHGPARPVMSLSENSINMALLKLAAMQVGIPFLPVSPSYSLASRSFAKLKYVIEKFSPSLIYVADSVPHEAALQSLPLSGLDIVSDVASETLPNGVVFDDLVARPATALVDERFAETGPSSVAKILLTSGSTGLPKGVINTHRMMCVAGVSTDSVWPFLGEKPPVIVDWLPWNHTFGTNFNFNQILRHGGTMYIDAGKPSPNAFEITLRNLRAVQPTLLYNVPRGYDALIPELEKDPSFAQHLLEKIDIIFYAGSALPAHLWERLDQLAIRTRGARIPILSTLGSTETGPVATLSHWPGADIGSVGLPVPGVSVKLVPEGQKYEFRVKGQNITPGYYNDPVLTAQAFDEEGYFKLGDAVNFVDPERPERGLRFEGRISENFKLSSGTWVQVGEIRLAALSSAAPIIQDAVVTGHDRNEIGLLIFPNFNACRELTGQKCVTPEDFVRDPVVQEFLRKSLNGLNGTQATNSRRICRVLLMAEPPSIDANEITDKGYTNQRAVLERRRCLVERLYAETPSPDVITLKQVT